VADELFTVMIVVFELQEVASTFAVPAAVLEHSNGAGGSRHSADGKKFDSESCPLVCCAARGMALVRLCI
jgi:hypothetical protein